MSNNINNIKNSKEIVLLFFLYIFLKDPWEIDGSTIYMGMKNKKNRQINLDIKYLKIIYVFMYLYVC